MSNEIELDRTPTTIRGATRYEMIRPEPRGEIIPFREMTEEIIRLPTNSETDANALMTIGAISEKSTPEQRARATALKMVILSCGATAISIIAWGGGASGQIVTTVEIVGLLISTVVTIGLDQRDSPLATERSKSKDYKLIRMAEISAQERMFNRRMDGLERMMLILFNANNRTK
jgi:hypothetical protein